jgi:hypothetical protein
MALLLASGCMHFYSERVPVATAPEDIKRVTFEIVARDNRCEPAVLAADREGRAILITFKVTSVGREHAFLIPDLDVRKMIPAGTEVSIPVRVERSGIYEYGCTGLRWLGPLDFKGKLAIK